MMFSEYLDFIQSNGAAPAPAPTEPSAPPSAIIGAALPRIDGPLKTTGTAAYASDYNLPRMVYAVPVRATIASGKILSWGVSNFDVPDLEEVAAIEGFDENVAEELVRRAEAFLQQRDNELNDQRLELGVSDEIAAIEVLSPQMLVALGEKGVKTLDDLADLASDELVEILGVEKMDEATANEVIMHARAHWFEGEEAPAATQEAGHD